VRASLARVSTVAVSHEEKSFGQTFHG